MAARKSRKRRGPKPDALKLPVDWDEAITKALKKKRPAEGWPELEKSKKKSKRKSKKGLK